MLYEEKVNSFKFKYATKIGGWARNNEEATAYFQRWCRHTWGLEWGNKRIKESEGLGGNDYDQALRRGFIAGFLSYEERIQHATKIAALQERKRLSKKIG